MAALQTGLGVNGNISSSDRRRKRDVTIVAKWRRQDNTNGNSDGDSNDVGASLTWLGRRSHGSSCNQVPCNKLDGSIGIL